MTVHGNVLSLFVVFALLAWIVEHSTAFKSSSTKKNLKSGTIGFIPTSTRKIGINLKTGDEDEDGKEGKFRVIQPNDISKLFDSIATDPEVDDEDDEEFDWENDEDEDEDEDEKEEGGLTMEFDNAEDEDETESEEMKVINVVAEPTKKLEVFSSVTASGDAGIRMEWVNEKEEISLVAGAGGTGMMDAMDELRSMERAIKSPPPVAVPSTKINNNNDQKKEKEEILDDDMAYANLNVLLDQRTLKKVKESMTVKEAPDRVIPTSRNRVFNYDPTENVKVDRMLYGAYRRWNAPEMEGDDGKTKTKRRNKKDGPKGKSIKKSDKTNKKDGGFTSENFFDAIKNVGNDRKGTNSPDSSSVRFFSLVQIRTYSYSYS